MPIRMSATAAAVVRKDFDLAHSSTHSYDAYDTAEMKGFQYQPRFALRAGPSSVAYSTVTRRSTERHLDGTSHSYFRVRPAAPQYCVRRHRVPPKIYSDRYRQSMWQSLQLRARDHLRPSITRYGRNRWTVKMASSAWTMVHGRDRESDGAGARARGVRRRRDLQLSGDRIRGRGLLPS